MRTETLARVTLFAIVIGATAYATGPQAQAQSDSTRRGGPRDWSHGRIIASDLGPDLGQNIERDWRTHAKRVRLAHLRELRNRLDLGPRRSRRFARSADASDTSHLDWNLSTGGYGDVVGAPARYSFDITESHCSDVIYFTVDHAGTKTRPNVIAITNPYAGCSGNPTGATPTVKWALRMSSGTATSAVPSLDGTVLYVLESRATSVLLHAINVDNITNSTGTYSFTKGTWSNVHSLSTSPVGTATSEQRFQITFSGVVNNVSSPFLDYASNEIFFGDSAGRIQHVVNAHLPTASRDTTHFTQACGNAQLQSPVFVNGQVIVSSYNGFIYRLNTTGAAPYTCVASAQLGAGTGAGVSGAVSPPIVDVSNDAIILATNNAAGYGIAGIGVMNLMFGPGELPVSGQMLGPATASTIAPVTPALDDAFWTTNVGNLYGVGANMAGTDTYLVRFPYNGTVGAPWGYARLHRSGSGSVVASSPVTEFLTASSLANKDFVFVGGGGGTYLFMNRIGAGFAGTDAAPVSMDNWFAVTGGVISQITIDTRTTAVTGSTATANIYFGTRAVGTATKSTIVQLAQQF